MIKIVTFHSLVWVQFLVRSWTFSGLKENVDLFFYDHGQITQELKPNGGSDLCDIKVNTFSLKTRVFLRFLKLGTSKMREAIILYHAWEIFVAFSIEIGVTDLRKW